MPDLDPKSNSSQTVYLKVTVNIASFDKYLI